MNGSETNDAGHRATIVRGTGEGLTRGLARRVLVAVALLALLCMATLACLTLGGLPSTCC